MVVYIHGEVIKEMYKHILPSVRQDLSNGVDPPRETMAYLFGILGLNGNIYVTEYRSVEGEIGEGGVRSHKYVPQDISKVDKVLNEVREEHGRNIILVGWAHTHPIRESDSIFMSKDTDIPTQKRWQAHHSHSIAMVINPLVILGLIEGETQKYAFFRLEKDKPVKLEYDIIH